jgi:hypothetical protein
MERSKRDAFALQPGRRYLAYISNIGYRHWTLSRGDPPALDPNFVIHHLPPRPIEGGTIAALPPDPPVSLDSARRAIGPIAAADSRVLAQLPRKARSDLAPAGTDGIWLMDSADGRKVVPTHYWVQVSGGAVTGGYDDCNWWGRTTYRGEAAVESTAVGCPDEPIRSAYQAALMRQPVPKVELQGDGSIKVALGGHELVFRRPLH